MSIGREINKAVFKSRWDNDKRGKNIGFNETYEKTFTPMPFWDFPKGKSVDEIEILIRKHRLDDLQRRLALGDFEINDPDLRSPSPDSAFDPTYKSITTREARAREKCMNERNFIIEELLKLDNTFIAPADYKPPIKKRKIYVPEAEYGDTNFIGLIIGPGGKTHKDLEKRSRCKIFIRGRDANIKSKIYNRKDHNQNEPLHIVVESPNEADLEIGVRLVEELLDPSSDVKKNQLIEMAAIRGTLRDDWWEDCGERGHRRFECPNKVSSWKRMDMKCDVWGQSTHPTKDCPVRRGGWDEGLCVEDDLNEFLAKLKSKKAKMIENGKEEEKDDVVKDNAFNHITKKVVNEIEKEAPGSISKEIKKLVQPYQKKEEAEGKLSDRVVALINDNNKVSLNGMLLSSDTLNPLQNLYLKYKDSYGKLLATQAMNFYHNYVQPLSTQAPMYQYGYQGYQEGYPDYQTGGYQQMEGYPNYVYPSGYPSAEYPNGYASAEYPNGYTAGMYPGMYANADYQNVYPNAAYPNAYPGSEYPYPYAHFQYPNAAPGAEQPNDIPSGDQPNDNPGAENPDENLNVENPDTNSNAENLNTNSSVENPSVNPNGERPNDNPSAECPIGNPSAETPTETPEDQSNGQQ